MATGWRPGTAGLAVIAVLAIAACSATGGPATRRAQRPVPTTGGAQPAHATRAAAVRAGTDARPAPTGAARFSRWWAGSGYRQYDRVAMDLKLLIIKDALDDHDGTFAADARRLAVDAAAAAANLPPVGTADYRAAMRDVQQAGADALAGSYARAYQAVQAGLSRLGAFTSAAGLTAGSAPSS
jgi:hypothetical protein